MTKMLLITLTISIVGCLFLGHLWQNEKELRIIREKEIIALNGQKNVLEKEIIKRNEDVIKIQQYTKELEALAMQDAFDWDADISDTAVILQLKRNSVH